MAAAGASEWRNTHTAAAARRLALFAARTVR